MKSKSLVTTLAAFAGIAYFAFADEHSLDKYGGYTGIKGEATGFFHFEKIDGRYWFITPEGNVFFPVALSHLYSGESDLAAKNVYGGDADAWLKDSFEKARAMGFNSALGSATSPERNLNGFVDVEKAEALFRENNFPYAVGVILLKHPWEFVDGETLPDIFDPSYKVLIEERAEAVCPRYKDDPLVMGYYYGFGAFNKADQWVNHHLSLPPGSPGRDAIVDVLIKRYGDDVASFNETYGTELETIGALKDEVELSYEAAYERRNFPSVRPTLDEDQLADFEAIIQHMCVTLYRIGHDAIRKHDENHLILGSFIKEWALDEESWKAAAPYVDVMAPQHVNREIDVNAIATAVDMPIIFSDEYFGFHYPEQAMGHGAVESHDARGDIYRANLMRHCKDAQVIGVTYCACLFDQGGNTLIKGNQNGFYDLEGNPRPKLIADVTEMNHAVYNHATQPADEEELGRLHDELFATWDQYQVRPHRPANMRGKGGGGARQSRVGGGGE
ncbi:MAG: hypothetical protein AAF591_00810 [Verrucomicrobiota bacterium]